ncbi:nucleoside hydrolase [Mumia zhuanghuii]|uniref:Nucleoside hydrolase n=1 Tax=Mumia zhuanghuii TaxID=2585211 RepID=A0A5C4MNF3_9ACTN|nr:nucleoside hydrolase [Mumia zhuanghuii]TNC30020.1 nucleoside hydrolase [Mumia zhuanghuii]TNC45012.1 nucleoside hydrolase [Mumia zhuanghuii]
MTPSLEPSTTAPTPVVLDVDTGVDDALALMFAVRSPHLDVRAISCVAGNADVDQVVSNTFAVLDALEAPDIPVGRGAERPLVESSRDARHIHGADGMGDQKLPTSDRLPADGGALDVMRRAILDSPEPVTLVPLAPMTNIALLLRAYPEVRENLAGIVAMGGAAEGGNATAVAEFNVWHDPEAAAIVLGAGVPVTMYGLDVFSRVVIEAETYEVLRDDPDPAVALAGRLLAHSHDIIRSDPRVGHGGLIGDAGAACVVAQPDLVTVRRWPVHVELAPGRCRGQTVVDRRYILGEDAVHGVEPLGHLVDVAVEIDAERARDLFLTTINAGPRSAHVDDSVRTVQR